MAVVVLALALALALALDSLALPPSPITAVVADGLPGLVAIDVAAPAVRALVTAALGVVSAINADAHTLKPSLT